jgi:hypothetical protein
MQPDQVREARHSKPQQTLTEKVTLKQIAGYNPALRANGSRGSATCPAQARAAPTLKPVTSASKRFLNNSQLTVHGLAGDCQAPASMHMGTPPTCQHGNTAAWACTTTRGRPHKIQTCTGPALQHDPDSKRGHPSALQAEQQGQPDTCDSYNDQGAV